MGLYDDDGDDNDGHGDVDGDGEKFFMGKCCENEMA